MLADGRTIGAPFYAPRYWLELWDLGNRRVAFGSFEALLRPMVDQDRAKDVRDHCSPTRALIAAVGKMRVVGGRNGFWTDHWSLTLDGWRGYDLDGAPPPRVVAAIEGAHPMPTTFQEAHDEYAYWAWRAYGIGTVVAFEDGEGTDALAALLAPELDLVSQVRAERVRRLLVSDEVSPSIEGVETKLRMYLFVEGRDFALEASMLRDLALLRQNASRHAPTRFVDLVPVSAPTTPPVETPAASGPKTAVCGFVPAKAPKKRGVQNSDVTTELLRDPERPDREIARKVGVSPTTVNTERRRLKLQDVVRRVSRKNVKGSYAMARPAARRASVAASAPAATATPPGIPQPAITTPRSRPVAVGGRKQGSAPGSARAIKGEQLGLPWDVPQEG